MSLADAHLVAHLRGRGWRSEEIPGLLAQVRAIARRRRSGKLTTAEAAALCRRMADGRRS